MIPWRQLDAASAPGGERLRLMRRGAEFSIMLGGNELMNSRLSGSEQALAALAIARIKDAARSPAVLIGGLGMGFTLRAALEALPDGAEVTVAELIPAVIAWARGPMAVLFGACLSDPRVRLEQADVRALIHRAQAAYDVILLDVDNGPDGLTQPGNDALYSMTGLKAAMAALRPGGVLAVWSSAPDNRFRQRLRMAGFQTEEMMVRARDANKGARHVIWLAQT